MTKNHKKSQNSQEIHKRIMELTLTVIKKKKIINICKALVQFSMSDTALRNSCIFFSCFLNQSNNKSEHKIYSISKQYFGSGIHKVNIF